MLEIGTLPKRLARNRYAVDEESHIEVDQAAVRSAASGQLQVRICPAHVYSQTADGSLVVQHAACLECGVCLALAPPRTLRWHYPQGGSGVAYREG
jgi:ferredoxin like protein